MIEGRKEFLGIVWCNAFRFDDCGNEKGFVNIDATTDGINNFYGISLLIIIWRKKTFTESSHIKREAKTMISVRSRGTTYLCLKDDSYTGFYTVLNLKGSLRLTSACFVVYLLP